MITGIHHVGISVQQLDRAVAFYRDKLGMELVTDFAFSGSDYSSVMGLARAAGRMGVMRKGSLMLELFEFAQPNPRRKDNHHSVADCGITHFGFEVKNIEALYERLVAEGVRFHCPVTTFPSGMKAAYGRDMDGNVFEMLEMGSPP